MVQYGISGTYHNIFSIANCLTELGYKILNVVTWAKPIRHLTFHVVTSLIVQNLLSGHVKTRKKPHFFNYNLMKQLNAGKQMTDVWHLPAIAPWEKSCGKHPTQKPLSLLSRIIMASTKPGEWILDPFCGCSTTGIAANLLRRRFLGIDKEQDFLEISKRRREEIENNQILHKYRSKIKDIKLMDSLYPSVMNEDIDIQYIDLPF